MKKLKERWNVNSNKQLVIILLVFAITGFSSLELAKPFLSLIGIPESFQPHWLYRVLRLVLIFPIYQVLLVLIGFIFGQFSFFWKLPIFKNIFIIPNIKPVTVAVTKDFNTNFVIASVFEKSISNNP